MGTLDRLSQSPAAGPVRDSGGALPPLADDFDDFLDLFEDLRGLVPASFFQLFKIARVLRTSDAKLAGQLKGFFEICEQADRTAPVDQQTRQNLADQVPVLTGHDPFFGLRRIKSIDELSMVRPSDVAEEEITDLLRRAEEGQLQVRAMMPKEEGLAELDIAPIRDGGTRSLTNAAEQKLYILFDRSYSMLHRHRLLFAKVLAIEYLRRKKSSGSRLFFRAFDFEVYQLEKLSQPADFDALIRQLLFIEPGGKGTDIAHAIAVAADDIKFDGMFENAEILIITDGMDRIEPEVLRETIGEKTKLHVVKIGRDAAEPQDSEIKDMIAKDQSVAGLSRDEVAKLMQHQIVVSWEQIAETLLETDDLDARDLDLGETEVAFALDAAEKIAAPPGRELTLTETENAFRKASFVEGFIDMLLDNAEDAPAVAARAGELRQAKEKLAAFKLHLATKGDMTVNLLAGKDVRFVTDRHLRRQAKKANMTLEDFGRLQESTELALQLKLGGTPESPPPRKGGISTWKLLYLVMRAAARSTGRWILGRSAQDEEEDEAEQEAVAEESPADEPPPVKSKPPEKLKPPL